MKRQLARLLRIAMLLLVPGAGAASAQHSVSVTACECALGTGDPVQVMLSASIGGTEDVGLSVSMQLPSGTWFHYRPIGLSQTPGAWLTLAPGTVINPVAIVNTTASSANLPFGAFPIVPPFRYTIAAVLFSLTTGQPITQYSVTHFDFVPEEAGTPLTTPGTLFVVPHHHNDTAWLDREDIYLPMGADFIRKALEQVTRHPDFHFVIDQEPVISRFERDYPSLFAALQDAVESGRAELAGGLFVESDLNLLSGESIVRQAIYGQEYLERKFGRRSRLAWNIDNFGHPAQMPQIAKKSGMEYYAMGRGIGNVDALGGTDFHWESPDGSRVLTHFMANSYVVGQGIGKTPQTDADIAETFRREQRFAPLPFMLGMDGADVYKEVFNLFVPEAVEHWNELQQTGVGARVGTAGQFFDELAAAGATLPLFKNREFQDDDEAASPRIFPGTYAARIEIKQRNARQEQLLLDAEKLATIASLEGFAYPEAALRQHGENLARNQTHDYLPGSGVDSIYDDADDLLNDMGDRASSVEAGLQAQLAAAAEHLVARVTTASQPGALAALVVFNGMAWERRELVSVPEGDLPDIFPAKLVDAKGKEITYQRLDNGDGHAQILFEAVVPSMGYTSYAFRSGEPAVSPDETIEVAPPYVGIDLGDFAVAIDNEGFLRSIVSKLNGQQMLRTDGGALENLGGVIWWADDPYGNAYEFGPSHNVDSIAGRPTGVFVLTGPLVKRVIASSTIGSSSTVVREMRLVPGRNRIDFLTRLYWFDVNKNVYLRFPWSQPPGSRITEGVPYGFMERGAGHFPALGWADWGNASVGVTVLNRGLFDHHFSAEPGAAGDGGQVLDITLLRSLDRAVYGEYPSQTMKGVGVHDYAYSLVFRHGTWQESRAARRAAEFTAPLLSFPTDGHAGTLPAERSYLSLNPASSAIVTVLQRQADNVVVRLFDSAGEKASHRVTFSYMGATTIDETNLLGDALETFEAATGLQLDTQPQEIVTLRLNAIRALTPGATDADGDGLLDAADNCPGAVNFGQEDEDEDGVGDACDPEVFDTPFQETITLDQTGPHRTTLYGAHESNQAGYSVFARGDVDGDGLLDLLVGADTATAAGSTTQNFAGKIYLIHGTDAATLGQRRNIEDVAALTISGVDPVGFLGTAVASGDLDGDGYDDLVLGSVAGAGGATTRDGTVYVFYGGPRKPFQQSVTTAEAAFSIVGGPADVAGFRLTTADVDGDGRADIVVAAAGAAGPEDSRPEAGEVYVIFGGTRAELEANDSFAEAALTLYGRRALDHFGWGLGSGDLNGDGRAEILVGAIDADGVPDNDREAAGEVYIIWGDDRSNMLGTRDMALLAGATVINGIDITDLAGFSVDAGDIDRDGRDDLLIGAPTSKGHDNGTGDLTGEAYVIFGDTRDAFGASLDLAASSAFTVWGAAGDDHLGLAVALGDINGDGYKDIVLGASAADGYQNSRPDSGHTYVILGRARALLPESLDLSEAGVITDVLIYGSEPFAGSGTSLSTGDLDGDGRDDLVVGSPFATGMDGTGVQTGQVAILFGAGFRRGSTAGGGTDTLEVLESEYDPTTGTLRVAVKSSVDELAMKRQFEMFQHDGTSVQQITATPANEGQHNLSGNALVWVGWDGTYTQIYGSLGSTSGQISTAANNHLSPWTDGTYVVWQRWDGNDFEIDLFDGETITPLTDNQFDDVSPRVDGGEVVWQGWDGTDTEIYLYRQGQVQAISNNSENDISPRLAQGRAAWLGLVSNVWQIHYFDGQTTSQLTHDGSNSSALPELFGDTVVWPQHDGNDYEIFRFAGGVTDQLTDNDIDDLAVQIGASGIVWQQGLNDASEIVRYRDGVAERLTDNELPDIAPQIHGQRVVWQALDQVGGTFEVMLHDGAQIQRLTTNTIDDADPVVGPSVIAWRGFTIIDTLAVEGVGPLTWDSDKKMYVGRFQVAEPPSTISIVSPIGGTATPAVAHIAAADASLTPAQVSSTGGQDPQVQGRWIAWHGSDGDQEIYLDNACVVTKTTNNPFEDVFPRLQQDTIVWQGRDDIPIRVDIPGQGQGGQGYVLIGGDFEIWKRLPDGTVVRLTDNEDRDDIDPRVDGGRIVWRGWDGDFFQVFLHDGTTTTQLTADPNDHAHVRTSGGRVVWQAWDGVDYEIFLWDGAQTVQLTNNAFDDLAPEIDGTRVVWFGGTAATYQIYSYDGAQVTALTSNGFSNVYPQIRGNRVAWHAWDGTDFEVFYFDGAAISQLTDNDRLDERPRLDGSSVVWQGSDGHDIEIFAYDGATTRRVTGNTWDDLLPEVSGGLLVWQGYDGNSFQIFKVVLPGREPDVCPPPGGQE